MRIPSLIIAALMTLGLGSVAEATGFLETPTGLALQAQTDMRAFAATQPWFDAVIADPGAYLEAFDPGGPTLYHAMRFFCGASEDVVRATTVLYHVTTKADPAHRAVAAFDCLSGEWGPLVIMKTPLLSPPPANQCIVIFGRPVFCR